MKDFIEKRRKQRQREPNISFIDGNGNFIKMSTRHLNETGSMFAKNEYHRKTDFSQELGDVRKQVRGFRFKIKFF